MSGLHGEFTGPLRVAALLAVTALAVASAGALRRRRHGEPWLGWGSRLLAVGAALVVVVVTASPRSWPPELLDDGDLVLPLGAGGLADWRVLVEQPGSPAAVLLVANVLVYVPLGLLLTLGWRKPGLAAVAVTTLSSLIEIVQWRVLGRVASTDDLLLNTGGGLLGIAAACLLTRARRPRERRDAPRSTA